MQIKEMSDEHLLNDMMDWFRVSRNEGGLKDTERKHFQDVCKEINRRDLLNPSKLFIDKAVA